MDLEELRRQIDSGEIQIDANPEVIEEGELADLAGDRHAYKIECGWNVLSAMKCDRSWSSFTVEMFEHIRRQGYSEEERNEVLDGIDGQHFHWDWFRKSIEYTTDGYEYFFLFVEGEPQGACIIYHPKESVIDSQNIFYIKYLMVAPWNNINPLSDRRFKGIGPVLICCAINYAVNSLGLAHGFSLHSLPQAVEFYEKLGMINFHGSDEGDLPYYEMPRNLAMELVGSP